jgi:tRNA(Ile)-lysidine synthase
LRPTVAVAFSGGADSTALLWATARQGVLLGVEVVALHVNHGLQPEAAAWEAQAQAVVERLTAAGLPVRLRVRRLAGAPAVGESVEAWARRGRYAALAEAAREVRASLVLLAHHADDQAETVLLQALRGAGPAGLAAMPERWVSADGIAWQRPWLHHRRATLLAVAEASGLPWVQDPSNADPRFARNRLRRAVMPALEGAFPHAVTVLGQVAAHAAQARALADEVAEEDLPPCVGDGGRLCHAAWVRLPPARRHNALRAWLQAQLPAGVPVALLERLGREWRGQGARWPAPGGWLRSQQGLLAFEHSPATK